MTLEPQFIDLLSNIYQMPRHWVNGTLGSKVVMIRPFLGSYIFVGDILNKERNIQLQIVIWVIKINGDWLNFIRKSEKGSSEFDLRPGRKSYRKGSEYREEQMQRTCGGEGPHRQAEHSVSKGLKETSVVGHTGGVACDEIEEGWIH